MDQYVDKSTGFVGRSRVAILVEVNEMTISDHVHEAVNLAPLYLYLAL